MYLRKMSQSNYEKYAKCQFLIGNVSPYIVDGKTYVKPVSIPHR